MSRWTYDSYWTVVLGTRSPDDVVREFELKPGLDEWLAQAECEVVGVANIEFPPEWHLFHEKALSELESAASERSSTCSQS